MSICRGIQNIVMSELDRLLELKNSRSLKEDNSYVSDADLIIQRKAIEFIMGLDEDYEIISEEIENHSFHYDPSKNYIVIDPLDGTENFVSGLKEWGVGVSVYRRNVHRESMILLPELAECLVTGSSIRHFESRIYGMSSSLSKPDIERLPEGYEYRITGCSMYNIFNTIRGSFRVFENVKGANCWDILPGLNLALEHGVITYVEGKQYHGEFLSPDRKYRIQIRHR